MAALHDPLADLARLFDRAAVPYALIGGHAVNAWLEPRFTADVDVTVQAGAEGVARLRAILEEGGFAVQREYGADLPSGPDFVRFVSRDGLVRLEVQAAKTDLQRAVVARALSAEEGVRVATPEDLIVLKLIADRPKDWIDLTGLARLGSVDWAYVERWAKEWEILDRLERLRGG
jgi:hypothetical protein